MKKIGITGGMGFIGGYAVEELQLRGYTPIIFDHHKRSLDEYPQGVEVFVGSLTDKTAVTEFVAHVDGVIHLAGCLGTQETISNPYPALETNLIGGIHLLEAVSQYNIPMVNIAVGNWWMNNPYSITKNTIERFVKMYNKERKCRINVLRVVNAYGPRQVVSSPFGNGKVRKVAPSFICRCLSGQPIEIYGDGNQISDMVYVADVAKALVSCLEYADRKCVFDEAIEIGPKNNTSVLNFAKLIVEKCVSKGYPRVEINHLPMRPGEIAGSNVTAKYETLSQINMPIDNLVSLEEGVNITIDYYINYLKEYTKLT